MYRWLLPILALCMLTGCDIKKPSEHLPLIVLREVGVSSGPDELLTPKMVIFNDGYVIARFEREHALCTFMTTQLSTEEVSELVDSALAYFGASEWSPSFECVQASDAPYSTVELYSSASYTSTTLYGVGLRDVTWFGGKDAMIDRNMGDLPPKLLDLYLRLAKVSTCCNVEWIPKCYLGEYTPEFPCSKLLNVRAPCGIIEYAPGLLSTMISPKDSLRQISSEYSVAQRKRMREYLETTKFTKRK
jgi:hypothetical protein